MEAKVVVVELEHAKEKTVYGTSGLMLNETYVLVTSNVFQPILDERFVDKLHRLEPNRLHPNPAVDCRSLSVVCQNHGRTFDVRKAGILAVFSSANLRRAAKDNLRDWCVDSEDNRRDLDVCLATFFVLSVDGGGTIEGFRTCLGEWWEGVKHEEAGRLTEVLIKCAPFGNRRFLESHNRGVISNVLGPGSCLILSDCPTVTGSEGSPVFKFNSKGSLPFGIVISCMCWWRGDRIDLTLVADVRSLLVELLHVKDELSFVPHYQLIANIESSLVHVYCGSTWGTGILVSPGIIITNSHVVTPRSKVTLHWKGQTLPATLVYRTPDDKIFDLAVLTCDGTKRHNLKPISVCETPASVGDEVLSAGFCLFSKDVAQTPTLSRGYVSMCSPTMMKTTCCVNAGMSGGPILNRPGQLQGVIVSNTKLGTGKLQRVFPRVNMGIPYLRIKPILDEFARSKDSRVLEKLYITHHKDLVTWSAFEPSKL